MKKLVLAVSLMATPFLLTPAFAGPCPKPKDALKTAVSCILEGMESGAYNTLTAEQLADYCIDVALRVHGADYAPVTP